MTHDTIWVQRSLLGSAVTCPRWMPACEIQIGEEAEEREKINNVGSLRKKGAGFCFGAQIREAIFNTLCKTSTIVIDCVLTFIYV